MGRLILFIILAFSALAVRAVVVTISASDSSVGLSPLGSWSEVTHANKGAQFMINNTDQGVITYVSPTAFTVFEFWGVQRSDGALYNISFDGGPFSQIDAYNATSLGSDGPKQLFVKRGLNNTIHSIRIVNVVDPRPRKPQYVDHFVLIGDSPSLIRPVAPVFRPDGFLAEGPLEFSYHGFLSLGANSPANRGSGATLDVLLNTGVPGNWVIWSGCREDKCRGHHTFNESTQHFSNFSINDTQIFPTNTLNSWRVNDTVTFSNISILSTTLDATYHLPLTGESLDGEFGLAKSFCGGVPCSTYPNLIEAMYEAGVIKAPVIAFYQLNSTDMPVHGVESRVNVGGLDHNKYIGSMDWIPVTTNSEWENPSAQRFVRGANATVDATAKFNHTTITFVTGYEGLLTVPERDWEVLLSLVGAKTANSTTLFPCTSAITFNFRGTQDRNYTFPLVNPGSDNGQGFCNPAVYNSGDTDNWLAGSPLLDNYYVALYYGERGINSTIGFGVKNLASSASTARLVVGSA